MRIQVYSYCILQLSKWSEWAVSNSDWVKIFLIQIWYFCDLKWYNKLAHALNITFHVFQILSSVPRMQHHHNSPESPHLLTPVQSNTHTRLRTTLTLRNQSNFFIRFTHTNNFIYIFSRKTSYDNRYHIPLKKTSHLSILTTLKLFVY
jgi:hypothetical protein